MQKNSKPGQGDGRILGTPDPWNQSSDWAQPMVLQWTGALLA